MINIRNKNDIMTDDAALGPSQMGVALKSATTYNQPGLPKPPGGWGKKLGFGDEPRSPDACG